MIEEEFEEDILHYNTEDLVCPHCGFTYYDCEDFTEEEGKENCVSCGEFFSYRKNIWITWDSNANT